MPCEMHHASDGLSWGLGFDRLTTIAEQLGRPREEEQAYVCERTNCPSNVADEPVEPISV